MSERLYPEDAPFVAGTVPRGWSTLMTAAEADAANLLYPVPPYGFTYEPPTPPEPPLGSALKFVRLDNVISEGSHTWLSLTPEDEAKLAGHDTLTIWPIEGRAGILDELVARAVRITHRDAGRIKVNVDTDGLNLSGLVFLGVLYDPA
jgi:hypothetical protein